MIDHSQIQEGMLVRSSDGKELGRVLACGEKTFVVEKGFYFATDYVARYEDVTAVSRGEVRLSRSERDLAQGERAPRREGALGESFTFGVASGIEKPWAMAMAEEEEQAARGGSRGDDDDVGPSRALEEPGGPPPTYGDEGGGGLL